MSRFTKAEISAISACIACADETGAPEFLGGSEEDREYNEKAAAEWENDVALARKAMQKMKGAIAKKNVLYLTENEIIYLQRIMSNILTDRIHETKNESDSNDMLTHEEYVKLLAKVEAL